MAARHGHVKMVEALLDDDANPLLKSTVSVLYELIIYYLLCTYVVRLQNECRTHVTFWIFGRSACLHCVDAADCYGIHYFPKVRLQRPPNHHFRWKIQHFSGEGTAKNTAQN